ncbi:matrixin family metalloprotease [Bdellovibrionota bacterium FG-1]
MRRRLFLAWFSTFLISIWGSVGAFAFTIQVEDGTSAQILAWVSPEITVDVNSKDCVAAGVSAETLNAAIDRGFAVWNSSPASALKLIRGGEVTKTSDEITSQASQGNPLILCDANMGKDLGYESSETSNIPAVTRILRLDSQRHIALAAMYINADTAQAANVKRVNEFPDLLALIIAHEVGHVFGLGHSVDPNTLMYYDATAKKQLSLGQDDIEGVTYLYPRHEIGNSLPLGCGTITQSGPRSRGGKGGAGSTGIVMEWFTLLCVVLVFDRYSAYKFSRRTS